MRVVVGALVAVFAMAVIGWLYFWYQFSQPREAPRPNLSPQPVADRLAFAMTDDEITAAVQSAAADVVRVRHVPNRTTVVVKILNKCYQYELRRDDGVDYQALDGC